MTARLLLGAQDGGPVMACEFICDGCGKRVQVRARPGGYFPPNSWYSRRDADGGQEACSRECLKKVAECTGKTSVVLPI